VCTHTKSRRSTRQRRRSDRDPSLVQTPQAKGTHHSKKRLHPHPLFPSSLPLTPFCPAPPFPPFLLLPASRIIPSAPPCTTALDHQYTSYTQTFLSFPFSQNRKAVAPTCALGARSSSRRTTTTGRRAFARTRPSSDVWAAPWPTWSTRAAASYKAT